MTLASSFALFFAMLVLAVIPGPGIMAVLARTGAAGFGHGASTTAGIVVGDFVFITIAVLGLAALSSWVGELFVVVKYCGAAYLIWLGISVLLSSRKAKGTEQQMPVIKTANHFASFLVGLVITLGNPKAILFYLSFLPAFMDLAALTFLDMLILYFIATLAVGGVMLGYAFMAHLARRKLQSVNSPACLRQGSSVMLIACGLYVAVRG